MGRLKGQFQALLGQTITSLARVALTQDNKLSPLMDTLLFTCCNSRNFELLVEQDTVKFEELSPTNNLLFASFELEPSEQLQQFSIKPATKVNPKTKPSIGFSTFICGTFDCNLL